MVLSGLLGQQGFLVDTGRPWWQHNSQQAAGRLTFIGKGVAATLYNWGGVLAGRAASRPATQPSTRAKRMRCPTAVMASLAMRRRRTTLRTLRSAAIRCVAQFRVLGYSARLAVSQFLLEDTYEQQNFCA